MASLIYLESLQAKDNIRAYYLNFARNLIDSKETCSGRGLSGTKLSLDLQTVVFNGSLGVETRVEFL